MKMTLSLFSRFFLGYFFLLVLAVGMSLYAIVQLGDVTDVTNSIIQADNALIGVQKDMTDALLSETRYEKKYLIMQDRAFLEGYLKSRGEFERLLREARFLAGSDDALDAVNRVADHHLVYYALFKDEAEYLKDGITYDRSWYAGEKDRAVNEAIEDLISLRTLGQARIVDKVKNLSDAGTRAHTIAMAVSAAMLLFGIILAVWITRSITRPLALMQKKTRDIAAGVFEPDMNLPSPPEIGALAGAFNIMCAKLKEVDRMKMDFFALMSHELRTPLTSIKEGTNLFLEGRGGDVTEKQKRLLSIVAEESNRLIGLVNSILDLTKLEAGMLAFNFSRSDLSPLIRRVMVEMGPLAEAKHITITPSIGRLPGVSIDSERILQVMRNLVGNALNFTPRGGSIRIAARQEQSSVLVVVSDTGPGIPREHAAAVFDKFKQVPGSARMSGTGLGLAIVKHIMQAHGGTVWVESESGSGSSFCFQLPV